MREFTQTTLHPRGNCWQTAVACVLDLDPEELPSQFDAYTQNDPESVGSLWSLNYGQVLQPYLRKHHGLGYVEILSPPEVFASMRAIGYHLLTGRTERSAAQNDSWHVVVAKDGEMIWDPHPSHAGLDEVLRWAFLTPFPKSWERNFPIDSCVCPKCKAGAT